MKSFDKGTVDNKKEISVDEKERINNLKHSNESILNRLNCVILDGMDVKFIENYLRKRKLIDINASK